MWSPLCFVLVVAVALASDLHPSAASGRISSGEIIDVLAAGTAPLSSTRGLTPLAGDETRSARPLDDIDMEKLRQIDSVGPGGFDAATIQQAGTLLGRSRMAAIDLPIGFDFDSATPSISGYLQLGELGAALTSETLGHCSFILVGHTDAKGESLYNGVLSKRRADTVREFLVRHYAMDGSRLIALGLGETSLRLPDDPENAANRRVEVFAFVPGRLPPQ